MTKELLDAQLALFKAQMQYNQASPGKVEVIEELVSKVGKLLEDEKAERERRYGNSALYGTEGGSEETRPSQIDGAREAAVEKKLEFLDMMSQLQTTRDSLVLDNELYDIVGQRVADKTALLHDLQKQGAVYMNDMMTGLCSGLPFSETIIKDLVHQLCKYAGSLATGPFLELISELPNNILGLMQWLMLRPHHAPLLNALIGIMASSFETNTGHQGSQPQNMAERSEGQSEPYVGYIKAFVPASETVHCLLPHALATEQVVAKSEVPTYIPSSASHANVQLTPTMIAKQGVQPFTNGPAYKPYSIKPPSVNGSSVIGPGGMVSVAPQGISLSKPSPLPAPQMDTPTGVTAQRRSGASVTPVDRHVHEAAAAAAEADDSGSDDDFHDPLQGMPHEPEEDSPAVNPAADVAHAPLPWPAPGPVDIGEVNITPDRVSETESEDALPLGESGKDAQQPDAQPEDVVEGHEALPVPKPLSQSQPQPQMQPQEVRQERPPPEQQEKTDGGPAREQQQEPKRARMEVTAEDGEQEAVAAAAHPKDEVAKDGGLAGNDDASVNKKMSFTPGQNGKGAGKEGGKGRKARMAAAKRAAEARRPVVPGAEPAEDPPAPAGAATKSQRAKQDAKQLEAKPVTSTPKWADEPVEGEHANEAQGWRDGGSSIYNDDSDSYIRPRSEASQDYCFDQDSNGGQASNGFEPRYPKVQKPLLRDAVAIAIEDKDRRHNNDRLEHLRQTWNCKKLFVGNLGMRSSGLSEEDLQSVFRSYNCTNVKICRHHDGSGNHKGYGFLTFNTPEDAFRALKEVDGTCPYPLYRRVRLEPVHDPNHPDDPPLPPRAHAPTRSSSVAGSQGDRSVNVSATSASEASFGAKHLFMSNVGSYVTVREVHDAFANYNLVDVRIPQFPDTGRNRHFAFLTFATDEDGYRALQEMNGSHRLFSQLREVGIRLCIDDGPQLFPDDVSGLETLETRELFLGNLDYRMTAEDIHEVFKDYDLRDARVPTDRDRGGLSKGVAFLTFATSQEALRALKEMHRTKFPGSDRTINLNPEYSVKETAVVESLETRRLYMGNLDESTTEDTICKLFKDFGIEDARVITHPNGASRGFAFLTFHTVQEALQAMKEMQGKEFPGTGRTIKLNPDYTPGNHGGVDTAKIEPLEYPRLFIGNIYGRVRERDIIEVFREYNVESVRIIYDRDGLSKHFGFLTFRTLDDARRALNEMNGKLLPGTDKRMKLAPDTDAVDGRVPAHARAHVPSTVSADTRPQSPGIRQAQAASRVLELFTEGPKKNSEAAKGEKLTSTKSQGKKGIAKAAKTVKELSETVANPFAALATDLVEE